MQHTKPHAVLLASAGMGHLIPVVELGKRLVTHHDFHATIFAVATDVSTAESILKSPYPNLNIVTLPLVDISSLVHYDIVTKIFVLMRESLPNLRTAILAMKHRPTALIVDLFGTEAFSVADDFDMLKYVFITSNAWFLALSLYAPTVEKLVEEEHVKQKKPLQIPGCKPVRFEDTLEVYLKMDDEVYRECRRVATEIPMADGILINTWMDLDPSTIEALKDSKKLGMVAKAPVYPVGPLVRPVEPVLEKVNHVMQWLDTQPSESVMFVSFGSGGTLSSQQTIELAWGLELSQQRFIWVFRPPVDDDASGSFFCVSDESAGGMERYLPDGFLTRTHKMGLVVSMWGPQREILAHPSVGGFLTHCGWNSTIESITNGVPMVAWPLYAEQKMNATLLAEELKVAVRSDMQPTNGIIGREEIKMMVKKIMEEEEGEAMRNRVKELKNSAEKALSKGGSSYNSLSQIAKDCVYSLSCSTAKAIGA